MKALIALLLCLSPVSLKANLPMGKTLLIVNYSGDDRVGASFVYAFKEHVSRSSRYTLDFASMGPENSYASVNILSTDTADAPNIGQSSAISFIVQRPTAQCSSISTHLVLVVGSSKVEQMSKEALAMLDRNLSTP